MVKICEEQDVGIMMIVDNCGDNGAEEWLDLSKVRLLTGEKVSNINQIIEILNHSILMSSI